MMHSQQCNVVCYIARTSSLEVIMKLHHANDVMIRHRGLLTLTGVINTTLSNDVLFRELHC